jgi:hypothetical protein
MKKIEIAYENQVFLGINIAGPIKEKKRLVYLIVIVD